MLRPALVAMGALLLLPMQRLHAQGGLLVQGVADVEFWKTDSASRLQARNNGKPAALARADIWGAIEPLRNFVLFAEVLGERGSARDSTVDWLSLKQGGLRYSPSDAFTLQVGKLPQIIGNFSNRALSYRNPLIAIPDGYSLTYPVGARVEGTVDIVDYRVGVLSRALYRAGYTPPPGYAMRPSAGVGITPFTGLRIGASATAGPYLSNEFTSAQLRNVDWKEYHQHIAAVDVQFSRGYFEGHAELNRNSYDVPGRATAIEGLVWYVETKYTFDPRFYTALRVEQNDYPSIRTTGVSGWTANGRTFNDAEIGVGFRPSAGRLLKLSARRDHWLPNDRGYVGGNAVALQFSQQFDVVEMLQRKR